MTTRSALALPLLTLLSLLAFSCASSTSPLSGPARLPREHGGPSIKQALIPTGHFGRHRVRHLRPRYITIHSTQSYGRGAGARTHARLLQRGALKSRHNSLGYLTWHFSVDDHAIYQSLPLDEQGQHADYEGPGNRHSIGIEMCENADSSFAQTRRNTAMLTAYLMKKYHIPLENVRGHKHWRMIRYSDKKDLGHKNCPLPLLESDGSLGPKWQRFLDEVRQYL